MARPYGVGLYGRHRYSRGTYQLARAVGMGVVFTTAAVRKVLPVAAIGPPIPTSGYAYPFVGPPVTILQLAATGGRVEVHALAMSGVMRESYATTEVSVVGWTVGKLVWDPQASRPLAWGKRPQPPGDWGSQAQDEVSWGGTSPDSGDWVAKGSEITGWE